MVKKEEKERVIGLIKLFVPQAAIYVFGSHARGDATELSDLDIALDQGSKIMYEVLSELKTVIKALYIPYKIDIVDLQRVSAPLKENIFKEHIIWKN
jgi:predicted nucleotidyltransferase